MKVNVTINLNIEAPDSTGFSGDVENLLHQIRKEMLDVKSPKREQLHAIFDEDKPADMTGYFQCNYDFMEVESAGGYKVSLRSTQHESEILVPVKKPAWSVGDKLLLTIEGLGKTVKEKVTITRVHCNTSLVDKGEGLYSDIQTAYSYTVVNEAGEIWPASDWELSLYLEA